MNALISYLNAHLVYEPEEVRKTLQEMNRPEIIEFLNRDNAMQPYLDSNRDKADLRPLSYADACMLAMQFIWEEKQSLMENPDRYCYCQTCKVNTVSRAGKCVGCGTLKHS